jgi:hypothetical protein
MAQIRIESDMTKKGSSLYVDGIKVDNLKSVSFSQYTWDTDCHLSYAVKTEEQNGFRAETEYWYDSSLASFVKKDKAEDEKEDKVINFSNYENM